MPRNGSGTYTLPAGNPFVTGTVISSTVVNNDFSDIATALTNSISADGQTPITANISLNSHRITGLSDGIDTNDAINMGQVAADVQAIYDRFANTADTSKGDALVGVKRTISVAVAETLHGWIDGAILYMSAGNGFAGNNSTDDTAAFNAACAALTLLGGGTLVGVAGKTYKCTSDVTVSTGVRINLNGCTVNFAWANGSDVSGFDLRDSSAIYGGTVNGVQLGEPTSANKEYHCPIYVGLVGANLAGYSNVVIRDLTITNNRSGSIGGRGVLVQSASSNVLVENLYFPDSSTIGSCVQVSWAGPGGSPPATSQHPHNICIRNIRFGTMTKSGSSFDVAAIDIVGAYNVRVENVRGVSWAGDAIWQVRPGGFGDTVAPAAIKPLLFKGIFIDGISVESFSNYHGIVNGKANNAAGTPTMSMPVKISGLQGVGLAGSAPVAAVRFTTVFDAEICDFDFSYADIGIVVDDSCERIYIHDGRVHHNNKDGVQIVHSNSPVDCKVARVEAYLNGQSGSGYAGVFVDQSTRTTVEDCVYGDKTSETTQSYGLRVTSSASGCYIKGRHPVRNVKAAGTKWFIQAAVETDIVFMGGSSAAMSTGSNEFMSLVGQSAPSTTEADVIQTLPQPMVLTNFRASLTAAPGGSKNRDLRIMKNSGSTAIELVISNSATAGTDFDAVEFAADDTVSVEDLPGSTPAAARGRWSCNGFLI